MSEPDADQWARLSLGIEAGEGHLLTVKLKRGDLAFLVGNALHALMMMGDEAAGEAGKRYVEKCEALHGAQRKFRAPFAPVIEPFIEEMVHLGRGYDLSLDAPRLESRDRGRRGRPFARATGCYVKVRFENEPSHRRIALLGGWRCLLRDRDRTPLGLLVLCRWKVVVNKRPRVRDFFALVPEIESRPREVCYLGTTIGDISVTSDLLRELESLKRDERLDVGTWIVTGQHVSDVLERTRSPIFLAGCPASAWTHNGG